MRGKDDGSCGQVQSGGITPAYAGKSELSSALPVSWRDHPRVCGEKKKMNMRKDKRMGSPPRMRGKEFEEGLRQNEQGITPAYAGKSYTAALALAVSRDHPRVCGEKAVADTKSTSIKGSPPRMRGKGIWRQPMATGAGITPAYAGKSCHVSLLLLSNRDHPRVCGEKTKKIPSHRPFQLHPVPVSFSFA